MVDFQATAEKLFLDGSSCLIRARRVRGYSKGHFLVTEGLQGGKTQLLQRLQELSKSPHGGSLPPAPC